MSGWNGQFDNTSAANRVAEMIETENARIQAERVSKVRRAQRQTFATAALPAVIQIAEAGLPKDMDPLQAAALIATQAFDIADAMIVEAEKRS